MLRRFRCNYRGCLIVFNVLKAAWLRHFPCCAYIDGAVAPVAPAAPAGPVGPTAPAGPVGPVAPAGPVAPVAPAAPAGPVGPAAPAGPVGPAGPVAPVAPAAPVAPVAPGAPVKPIGPVGPTAPVEAMIYVQHDPVFCPLKAGYHILCRRGLHQRIFLGVCLIGPEETGAAGFHIV